MVQTADVCTMICGEEVVEQSGCCAEPCAMRTDEVNMLAFCSGAYGTQNSLRAGCECTMPAKPPVLAQLQRLVYELERAVLSSSVDLIHVERQHIECPDTGPPPKFVSDVIASTVLRI